VSATASSLDATILPLIDSILGEARDLLREGSTVGEQMQDLVTVAATRPERLMDELGISDADKPHIFNRFYRATATRALPGSGLGLAIVAQFADDHDATTFVHDTVGGGAESRHRI